MIYQFDLYINLNSWHLDREEDWDLPQPHSIFFFPLAAKTNWTLRPFPFSSFFPATAAFRFKGTRQPSTPAHQFILHFFQDLSPIFDWPCHLLHYVLKTWLIWLWLTTMVTQCYSTSSSNVGKLHAMIAEVWSRCWLSLVNILKQNVGQHVLWLKSSLFGETTQILGTLCLWQCF